MNSLSGIMLSFLSFIDLKPSPTKMNFSLVSVDLNVNPFVVSGLTVTGLCTVYGLYKFVQYRIRVANREAKCVFITGCDSGFGR